MNSGLEIRRGTAMIEVYRKDSPGRTLRLGIDDLVTVYTPSCSTAKTAGELSDEELERAFVELESWPDEEPAMPPGTLVLVTALILARAEGAAEIGIDHLLAALDHPSPPSEPAPPEGPFTPAPPVELPLSGGACSVLSSLGGIENASVDTLRSALLQAKRKGAR